MQDIILSKLASAVTDFDPVAAETWAVKAVEAGVDPLEALDALTMAIRQVGDAFEKRDAFLPELVGAASAMQAAMPALQAHTARRCLAHQSRQPSGPPGGCGIGSLCTAFQ